MRAANADQNLKRSFCQILNVKSNDYINTNLTLIKGATSLTTYLLTGLCGLMTLTNLDCFEGALDPITGVRNITNADVNNICNLVPTILFTPFNADNIAQVVQAAENVLALYS